MAKDIRVHGISRANMIENEVEGMSQILARAADRIEKLKKALKYIAKHGRPIGIVDKVAKDALKYP